MNNDVMTNSQDDISNNNAEAAPAQAAEIRKLVSPGQLLKAAREKKELALSTVGKQLKLDSRVIEALEQDDYDAIGAPVFVKGHLRKYASFVDINPDDVMLAYYQVARTQDATPIISQTTPMTDPRPKFMWLGKALMGVVILSLIAALAYAMYRGWNWYLADAESSASLNDTQQAQSTSLQLPAPEESYSVTDVSASNANASNTLELPVITNVSQSSEQENVIENQGNQVLAQTDQGAIEESDQGSVSTEPDSGPAVSSQDQSATTAISQPSQANSGDQLRLVFAENCWVNIKDQNGRSLMNGIGYQGDVQEFVLTGDTEIRLGNVDGVELYLNGNPYTVPVRARSGKTAHFQLVSQQ